MKSKIFVGTLVLTVALSGVAVFADSTKDLDNIDPVVISEKAKKEFDSIKVDGKEINFKGENAYYKDDTLMLPLRAIAEEALGFEVTWNNEDRSIELQKDNRWTKIKIDENSYFFARMAPFKLSQGPELKNSSTFVPIEFFEEILKEEVLLEDNSLVVKDEEEILNGFIKEIDTDNKRILVEGDIDSEIINNVWLREVEDSKIINTEGKDISFNDLKVGSKVKVILPEILNLSYPAQGSMVKVEVLKNGTEIVKKEVQDVENNTIVRYPELKGMKDTTTQYYINENIKKFINATKGNELFQNLDLDYELLLIDEDKISLLFTGNYTVDGLEGEKTLINSFNLDLKTIEEIDFRNYFKKDKDSQEKLNQILNEKAIELGYEKFESENERIYFTGNDIVVYYYPLDDSIETPIYLSIPLKDLEDLIDND